MTILAVAVIGKENNPLYIHASGPKDAPLPHEEQVRYHLIMHTALDHVEERVAAQRQAAASGVPERMDIELLGLYSACSTTSRLSTAARRTHTCWRAGIRAPVRRHCGMHATEPKSPTPRPLTETASWHRGRPR